MKDLLKKLLARSKVRKIVFILQLPLGWTVIRVSRVFDKEWYRLQYGGHRHERFKNRTPLLHYLYVGRRLGLTPSPFFIPEYYDRHRWQHSIIDPLVKYLVQKENWSAATSVLFDGTKYNQRSLLASPLAVYIRTLRNGETGQLYDIFDSGKEWADIRDYVFEQVAERRRQFELQKVSEPIVHFDQSLASDTIEKYREYFASSAAPLVSIVMPAWNRQELIQAAIDSVLEQSYQNWELIVVDDGSTDSTVDVVQSYIERDKRIRLFTPGHGGVCAARNHGIEHANGSWVAFLDSDNTWTKDYLLTTVAMAQDSGKKVAYAAIKMNRGDAVLYRATPPNPSLLEIGNHIDLNALIVERSLLQQIGAFDTSLRRMVDYDLVIRLSKMTSFVYVPIVGVEYTDHADAARITTTESLSWDGVVKSKNFIDWSALQSRKRAAGTTVVLSAKDGVYGSVRALKEVLRTTGAEDIPVIVADASSGSAFNIAMASVAALEERVTYARFAASRDTVLAANYGYSLAKTEKVVFMDQHIRVEDGWFEPLVSVATDHMLAGPLQIQPSRTIRSAGVEFNGENAIPLNILEDHPLSDVEMLPSVFPVDGLMNGCFCVDATVFATLNGLNPLYDRGFVMQDFSLRAGIEGVQCSISLDSLVVNPDAGRGWYGAGQAQFLADWKGKVNGVQSKIWKNAGFQIVEYQKVHEEQGELSQLKPLLKFDVDIPGVHRWAIKISSPADERRHIWGDTHYAEALARALRKLGQRVAIDYHDFHQRPTSYLDDVVLDLRGLDNTKPQDGALNIMWVISHPEKVTSDIVNSFDLVFAAGKKWAEYMSEQSGKLIEYLPQCTDPEVFHPTDPDPKFAGKVLFVGSSRNVLRPIVRDAIEAGIDLNVYGGGWHGLIDERYIKGDFIANEKLTTAYSSAAVVLNDHWDDMREWGFISNRIFDVLATGSSVISDEVYGLKDTLDTANIYTYSAPTDLHERVCDACSGERVQDQAVVSYIKTRHSFEARAQNLCSTVDASLTGKK